MTTTNYIGAEVTVQYTDAPEELMVGYISFEQVPDDVDDNYVLPLAGLRDDEVMFYMTYSEFLKLLDNPDTSNEDFKIINHALVTETCE